jgi:hypothetical protein
MHRVHLIPYKLSKKLKTQLQHPIPVGKRRTEHHGGEQKKGIAVAVHKTFLSWVMDLGEFNTQTKR